MIVEYIEEALRRARYEIINNGKLFYAEVPGLRGVWATGKTLGESRKNLVDVIDGWLIIRLKKGLKIPHLGKFQIRAMKKIHHHV